MTNSGELDNLKAATVLMYHGRFLISTLRPTGSARPPAGK